MDKIIKEKTDQIIKNAPKSHYILKGAFRFSHKMKNEKHFYCFQIPRVSNQPVANYNDHAGRLVATQAVSPKQAANNAIYSTFHEKYGDQFTVITKHLHASFSLSHFALDMDELDKPTKQHGLFGGIQSSHRRLDESNLAKKISQRFNISDEGEKSAPKQIARKYIDCRHRHPLTK